MAGEGYREVRGKRGIGGKLVAFLFWGWHVLMVAWLLTSAAGMGEAMNQATSEAGRAGAAVGSTIGLGVIFFFWVAGTVILAIPFMLTRGQKRWEAIESES